MQWAVVFSIREPEFWRGFSKISRDPVGGFSFWHDQKLNQIEADPAVQVRDPGKFVFDAKIWWQSPAWTARFSENRPLVRYFCFWAALPGAQPWKGLRPNEERLDMACRDDKRYFIRDNAGQIERRKLTTFCARSRASEQVFRRFLRILWSDPCSSAI